MTAPRDSIGWIARVAPEPCGCAATGTVSGWSARLAARQLGGRTIDHRSGAAPNGRKAALGAWSVRSGVALPALAQDDLDLLRRALPLDGDAHLVTGDVGPHDLADRRGVGDLLVVDAHDHIADLEAGLRGGRVGL